ncbi:MAG: hypothetical protein EOR99_04365 [Mesorhizobium sp.]|nr:MAG: hypothetical protein EOR99_04365 [Mesorhizobium sp.]
MIATLLYLGEIQVFLTLASMPVFKASAKDPLLGWIASGSSLHINLGGETTYDVSLKGSAQAAKAFAAACNS